MIKIENEYEPIIYEQPFSSHIYENQLELLRDYYTRPIINFSQVTQEVNENNTVIKPDKKDEVRPQIIIIKTFKENNQKKKFDKSICLREPRKSRSFN